MSEWATPDRRRFVILGADVIAMFARYRQRFPWHTESGGILLGRRRGNHVEVVRATEPTARDKRSTYGFEREAEGHAQTACAAWRAAGGTIDYVGEWHTHPQRVPSPSSIDRSEWHLLAQTRPRAALVAVIVGTHDLHMELLMANAQLPLNPVPRISTPKLPGMGQRLGSRL